MIPTFSGSLGLGQIFIFFFITLGPFTVLRSFAQLTRDANPAFRFQLATRTFAIALVSALSSAVIGAAMMVKWHVSVPAITFTAGILLFIVALRALLQLYDRPHPPEQPSAAPTLALAASPLAFPDIVTPYGLAIAVALLSLAPSAYLQILGCLIAVIVIDYVVMLASKPLIRLLALPLSLIGVIFGVLQVALSLQIVIFATRSLLQTIR
jgi:multiple antibiotic resistance protein